MELRYLKFTHVHDISLLSEKLFGPVTLKHLMYFAFAVLFIWRGMALGSARLLGLGGAIALVGMLSSVYPRKSTSFEARLVMSLLTLVESLTAPRKPRAEKNRSKPAKRLPLREVLQAAAGSTSAFLGLYVVVTSVAHLLGLSVVATVPAEYNAVVIPVALALGCLGLYLLIKLPWWRGRK